MTRKLIALIVSLLLIVLGFWYAQQDWDESVGEVFGGGAATAPEGTAPEGTAPEGAADLRDGSEPSSNGRATIDTHHPRANEGGFASEERVNVLARVVDQNGELIGYPIFTVRLETTGMLGFGRDRRREQTVGGEARFKAVPSGKQVKLELSNLPRAWKEAAGEGVVPKDEPLVVELRTEWSGDVIFGRVVDEAGRPLADTPLRSVVKINTELGVFMESLPAATSDAAGEFRVYCQSEAWSDYLSIGAATQLVEFYVQPDEGEPRSGSSAELPRELPELGHNLGDVVMRASPVLARGRVVSERGQALAGARIRVERVLGGQTVVHGDQVPRTVEMKHVPAVTSADDGSFEVRGADPKSQIRVTTELAGHWAEKTELHDAGARELTIVMLQAGGIAGSLRIAEGEDSTRWRMTLQRLGDRAWEEVPQHGSGDRWDPSGEGDVAIADSRTGEFGWSELPPGTYSVAIRSRLRGHSLLLVEDIRVLGGETTRPAALAEVDTTTLEQTLTLRILDESGQPISNGRVLIEGPDKRKVQHGFEGGNAVVRAPQLPLDVQVRAPGFLDVDLIELHGDREVIMRRGLPVRLELPHGLRLPDSLRIEVSLYRMGEPLVSGTGLMDDERSFDSSGVLETRVGAIGDWLAQLKIEGESSTGAAMSMGIGDTTFFEVGDDTAVPTIRLQLEQADIDAAAAEIAKFLDED